MTPEPEWVDLGLPSGLLWATANLGAVKAESPGLYFSWGNTEGHVAGTPYDFSQEVYNGTPGALIQTNIGLANDAARAVKGAPWRMPTADEFQELNNNCSHVWTSHNGVNGILFTSNANGRTLFIPAAGVWNGSAVTGRDATGDYWSSTYSSEENARILFFNGSSLLPNNLNARRLGFPIRPVREA